ncbi:Na+/H+ antiporter NhaC [Pseudoteredinibacter isoporae]|uniref:Na+/H+ antiporter NhaC n=1 Tax=Pseudoteredinibacter isoporae TaxID=570281 RepID=UPI00334047E7
MSSEEESAPSMLDSVLSVLLLVVLLASSVYLFGTESSYGGNQAALSIAAFVVSLIGLKNGIPWREIEASIIGGVSTSISAILILLLVGALVGSWVLSGTIPALVYWGGSLLDPALFYMSACILCAMISISVGSSWTTAATMGVGLIGVSLSLDLSPEVTAGAIISGAYFGDKMSPLSETTNMASAVTGVDLFTHIKHMMWTTVPSMLIAIVYFYVLGMSADVSMVDAKVKENLSLIEEHFYIGFPVFLPIVVVLFLSIKGVPALASIALGVLSGILTAVVFQGSALQGMSTASSDVYFMGYLASIFHTMSNGYQVETGSELVNSLLNRGGMSSMLNTVWLIVVAMVYGAVLERVGIMKVILKLIIDKSKSTGSLIFSTLLTCLGINLLTGDQYMAITLSGRMYKLEFKKRHLKPESLSRTVEDSATITSPLIPWNTCGAYMSATLGVVTLSYLPHCIFNILCPVMSCLFGYTGFKVSKESV